MRPTRRTLLAVGAGFALFMLLACVSVGGWSLLQLDLLAQRLLYQGFESVGVMDPNKGLGGQVFRHNFARDPGWAHWVVRGAAPAAAYGPALIVSLLVARRVRGGAGRTLCGTCGHELRRLTEARCPACGEAL